MMTTTTPPPPPVRFGVLWEVGIVWFIGLIGLVAMALLIFGAIQRSATEYSLRERYRVALFDLRENLETNLNFGFELADNPNAQTQLEEMLGRDASFQAVEIFDRDGASLFSTDRGSIGEKVPERWQLALAKSPDRWTVAGEHETVVGIPIINAFNERAGYLALTYSVTNTGWSVDARIALSIFIGSLLLIAIFTLRWVGKGYRSGQTLPQYASDPDVPGISVVVAEQILSEVEQRLDQALKQLSEDLHEA